MTIERDKQAQIFEDKEYPEACDGMRTWGHTFAKSGFKRGWDACEKHTQEKIERMEAKLKLAMDAMNSAIMSSYLSVAKAVLRKAISEIGGLEK